MNQIDPSLPGVYVLKRRGIYTEELLGIYTSVQSIKVVQGYLVKFEPDDCHVLTIQAYRLDTNYLANYHTILGTQALGEKQPKVIYSRKRTD